MRGHDLWRLVFWLGLSISLILLSGSGQDISRSTSPEFGDLSPGDNFSLDSSLLVPSASALPGEAEVNTVGPALGPGVEYTSIQEAIDDSGPGDVIYVQSGTYDEVVTVNKPGLSLKGVDSGDGNPVVSGDGVESTVTLASDGCTLDGFVIMNSGNPHAGINVKSSNNRIASNTIMENRGYGIHVGESARNNTISGNDALSNGFHGIGLDNTSLNNITANNLSRNNMSGIYLENSRENNISENTVTDNKEYGICLFESNRNVIARNIANNNQLREIEFTNSKDNIIEENTAVEVVKTAYPKRAVPKMDISFTIQVTNTGQVDLSRVVVSDRLPSGLVYVRDNLSGRIMDGEISWTLPEPLESGESKIIILIVRLDAANLGDLTNWVRVTGISPKGTKVSHQDSEVVTASTRVGPEGNVADAINVARPGDIIEVESGTYYENIVLDKTITLRGLDTGDGKPILIGDGVGSTITLNIDGCTLEGFEVTNSGNPHAGIDVISSGNTISGNVVRDNSGYGIRLLNSHNNFITDNFVNNNGFEGIHLEYSGKNLISGNKVENNSGYGLEFVNSDDNDIIDNILSKNQGLHLAASKNNRFEGNNIINNTYGVRIKSSSNNALSKNKIGNNGQGIYLDSSKDNTLVGNIVSNNNMDGIFLYFSDENYIKGNFVYENSRDGIRFLSSDDNQIGDNKIGDGDNGSIGIYLGASSGNVVSGNDVNKNDRGIYLESSGENNFSDNIVSDNKAEAIVFLNFSYKNVVYHNKLSKNNIGMQLHESYNNEITGNNISYNACGIYLNASDGNIINENTAENNGVTGLYGGIYIIDSNNNQITKNTANYNNFSGISLIGSMANTISSNEAAGNRWHGIQLESSKGNIIESNNASNSFELDGVMLQKNSTENKIAGNTVFGNNRRGICLEEFSSNNAIIENTITVPLSKI